MGTGDVNWPLQMILYAADDCPFAGGLRVARGLAGEEEQPQWLGRALVASR